MELGNSTYTDFFFKIDMCSPNEISRRDPLNVAERRSIMKNIQNMYYPRFIFSRKELLTTVFFYGHTDPV